MKNKKFPWGEVIDRFEYDFDGIKMEVVKFISKYDGSILYCCEEIRESSESLFYLVIAWMAKQQLGSNEGSLVVGICKALEIK